MFSASGCRGQASAVVCVSDRCRASSLARLHRSTYFFFSRDLVPAGRTPRTSIATTSLLCLDSIYGLVL